MSAAGGEAFGATREGEEVRRIGIAAGALSARILTYGAIVQDLRLEGHGAPLVLGFARLEDYLDHSLYFGAIVGRYANRIAGGRFILDGERFDTDRNDHGNTLHGGAQGLDRRVWRVAGCGDDFVTLAIADLAGTMGFPGTLAISCTYRIRPPATLAVEIEARTDRATLCNLAQHSYFNLDDGGAGSILDHRLRISAQAYTPVDEFNIPTGAVLPVQGTRFDFVLPRTIRPEDGGDARYDHNFCLSAQRGRLRQAAWAQGGRSGVEMEVWTSEPGLQFFSGQFADRAAPGLDGILYRSQAGFCLEPQVWPDSPNRPYFPQAILRPGEQYRQESEFRFRLPGEVQAEALPPTREQLQMAPSSRPGVARAGTHWPDDRRARPGPELGRPANLQPGRAAQWVPDNLRFAAVSGMTRGGSVWRPHRHRVIPAGEPGPIGRIIVKHGPVLS